MKSLEFKIIKKSKKFQARTGLIKTLHHEFFTPAFVPVGTGASVKSLTSEDLEKLNVDIFFVNTYHMMFRPGTEIVNKFGGLHKFMSWKRALMTDSGGFQAFSLSENGPRNSIVSKDNLIKIHDDGVEFKSAWDGKKMFIGPKESMNIQKQLGADIIMAFDECTFYPISEKRANQAMERTHKWAEICVKEKPVKQALYGIVQGSVFKDLRIKSAEFISKLNVEGLAIGSVANSKEPREKVFEVLDWTIPILHKTNKPVHFLGIGEIEDILLSVARGIDTLDCVTPTRMARMGWFFDLKSGIKNKFRFDITKNIYSNNKSAPVDGCECYTCSNYSKGYINHLFRSRELLSYHLATVHNIHFYMKLMSDIRKSISENKFDKLLFKYLN